MATVPEGYVALDFVGFTDKGTYSPDATYMQNDLAHLDNSIWKCRVDQTTGILPGDNDNWEIFINSTSELKGTTANDVNGLLGTAGVNVDAQMLIDAITDRVMNQLLAKSQLVTNLLATEAGNPLDATMGKALKDIIDPVGKIARSYEDLQTSIEDDVATAVTSITLAKGTWIVFGYGTFGANTNGYRICNISETMNSGAIASTQPPIEGTNTRMRIVDFFVLEAETTLYFNMRQNSGGDLSANARLSAVRIK